MWQISEKERARYNVEEMLDAERERVQLINQEWENLKEAREMAEKKVQQLQDRLRSVRSQAKTPWNQLLGTQYL